MLADLLLMFLYLEVLAMVRVFWNQQSISITLPLLIAITALEILCKASIKIITQDSMNMVYESLSTKGITILFNMKYLRKNKVINQMNELLQNKQVGYIEYNEMVKGLNKIKIHMQNPHHEVFAEVEKLAYKIKNKLNLS